MASMLLGALLLCLSSLPTPALAGFPGVTKLSVDRIAELDAAILNNRGQPWIIGCHLSSDDTKRKTLTSLLEGAAALLSDEGAEGAKRKRTQCPDCRIGELDCRKSLPTGKSVARALGISLDAFKKGWPVVVFAANGSPAVQLDAKHFSKADKTDKLKAYLDAGVDRLYEMGTYLNHSHTGGPSDRENVTRQLYARTQSVVATKYLVIVTSI